MRPPAPARRSLALLSGLSAVSAPLLLLPSQLHLACPIHTLTGLLCPGCGGTHCLIALLHGHLTSAWHSNPLLTVLLPAAALLLLIDLAATAQGLPSPATRLAHARPLLWSLAVATILFGVGRNLL